MNLKPRSAVFVCVILTCAACASRAIAADDPLTAALAKPIIGPRQTLAETQQFVGDRLPKMPVADSAAEWQAIADGLRSKVLSNIVFRGAAEDWRRAPSRVEWIDTISGGPGYHIKRLRYEAIPGMWIPALLYEPEKLVGKAPVVLNVNGHDSKGKAADYKQVRCINLAKNGILALNVEWFGMGQLGTDGFRHGLINAIDLCGSGGIATHFLNMARGLDILLAHPNADPARVAVTGLSGGGWQTIFFSSLDTRVTMSTPVAGYSGFATRVRAASDLGDSEQTPCDLATVVDYTHLTAMLAPRPTLLIFNAKDDCCFAASHALPPLLEAAAPIFRLYGQPGRLRAHVNFDPGTHNYLLDNRQAFYQFASDFWSTPAQVFNPRESPSEAEVKPADALNVPLPDDQLDFAQVAAALAKDLPRGSHTRQDLNMIVHPFAEDVKSNEVGSETADGVKATRFELRQGTTWTIPAVEIVSDSAREGQRAAPVLFIADAGRAQSAARIRDLVKAGHRVVAIDPFYFGEARFADHAYLWALMVATVGERPLGLQSGQVLAAARWLKKKESGQAVELHAVGPRTSTIALVAAALDADATVAKLSLTEPLGSLKEVIERKTSFDASPELFCFGLLERFDIKTIAELVGRERITLEKPSERARSAFEKTP